MASRVANEIALKYDKKNLAKTINLILITEIGESVIYPVSEEELI